MGIGIMLLVYGMALDYVAPSIFDYSAIEPQERITIAHSDHFQSIITKFNFIMDSTQKTPIIIEHRTLSLNQLQIHLKDILLGYY